MIIHPMSQPLNGVTPLAHLGVIAVQGQDAASFLQGQLTQDFVQLGAGQARLAAFCTAKGRMLASFVGLRRADDEILLVTSRDVLAPTLKRLSMFVLRAKAKLRDASSEFDLYGVAGRAAEALTPPLRGPGGRAQTRAPAAVSFLPPPGQTPQPLGGAAGGPPPGR